MLGFTEVKAGHPNTCDTTPSGSQELQPRQSKPSRAQGLVGSNEAGQTWAQKGHSAAAQKQHLVELSGGKEGERGELLSTWSRAATRG